MRKHKNVVRKVENFVSIRWLTLHASVEGHCMKSVQIRSFSGPYLSIFELNAGKHGPGKTSYLETFHAVGVCRWVCRAIRTLNLLMVKKGLGVFHELF